MTMDATARTPEELAAMARIFDGGVAKLPRTTTPLATAIERLREATSEEFASPAYLAKSRAALDYIQAALPHMPPGPDAYAMARAAARLARFLSMDWSYYDPEVQGSSASWFSTTSCPSCEVEARRELVASGFTADDGYVYPARALWEGPIGIEGEMTGDGRFLNVGSLRWDLNQNIPLRHAPIDVGAHDGAVIVGSIDSIERRENGLIWGFGRLNMQSEPGREAYRLVREGWSTGVSMDLDDVSFEVYVSQDLVGAEEVDLSTLEPDENGRVKAGAFSSADEVSITTDARIRGVTIVAIPAFADARISIVASGGSTFAGNPGQARAPKGTEIGGQWINTPVGEARRLETRGLDVVEVIAEVAEKEGATLDPETYKRPTSGYVVAIQGFNQEIPSEEFFEPTVGPDKLREWVVAHEEQLRVPGSNIGVWVDTAHNEVVLDVVEVIDSLDEAIQAGKDRNQQAIWDVVNEVEIPTGGTGDREQGLAVARRAADTYARRHRDPRGVLGLGRGQAARVPRGNPGRAPEALRGDDQARAPRGTPIGGRWILTPGGTLRKLEGASVQTPLKGDHAPLEPDAADAKGVPFGPDVVAAANSLHERAMIAEKTVSRDFAEALAMTGEGDSFEGLEYRVKEQRSLATKIRGDIAEKGSVEAASAGVFDAVRYTVVNTTDNFEQNGLDFLDILREKGYTVAQVKQTWDKPHIAYKGTNIKVVSPDGFQVELQMHTPESWAAKIAPEMHGIYDQQKLVPKGSSEFMAYEEQMIGFMETLGVQVPPGAENVK